MSQNLRKKVAVKASRRNVGLSPNILSQGGTPSSSRHNTDEEDAWSEFSTETVDSWTSIDSKINEDRISEDVDWKEEVLQSIDNLEEKRTSVRENALSTLIRLLSRKYTFDLLDSRSYSLLDLLCRSIKKEKSIKENRLATKVMSLLFITLGEEQDKMYQTVLPLLKYTSINSASPEVKGACIKTLGLVCFIAGSHTDAIELLEFFSNIIITSGKSVNATNNPVTITSALNSYGLLFSGLWGNSRKGSIRSREEFERVMPGHIKQLESTSMEVRVASGENIALMFESLGIGRRVEQNDKWGNHDHLTHLLNTLATDSNRHRAKADRKVQRSVFRDILKTVEDGDRIQEKLKFNKKTVYFSTWARILQLRAFRDVLADGLQAHFLENELLQAIFEFVPPPTLDSPRSRPDHDFNTGSDTDTSVSKRKTKGKQAKNRRENKRRGDLLEVG
ncbi:11955_t:CDS:2 [Acaulospora morrowiae]|uniref:11955_t:CDS:1 n=1 Tax=Acaulospora morrowiae TaxID=94023 RepID=A0A9N8WAG5_9GLOM|nr:11955_t:CDS:2 [Acaulospora morrowiae]